MSEETRHNLAKPAPTGLAQLYDFLAILIAGLLCYALWAAIVLGAAPPFWQHVAVMVLGAILFVAASHLRGDYGADSAAMHERPMMEPLFAWGIVVLILLLLGFAFKISDHFSRGWGLSWIVIGGALILAGRALVRTRA